MRDLLKMFGVENKFEFFTDPSPALGIRDKLTFEIPKELVEIRKYFDPKISLQMQAKIGKGTFAVGADLDVGLKILGSHAEVGVGGDVSLGVETSVALRGHLEAFTPEKFPFIQLRALAFDVKLDLMKKVILTCEALCDATIFGQELKALIVFRGIESGFSVKYSVGLQKMIKSVPALKNVKIPFDFQLDGLLECATSAIEYRGYEIRKGLRLDVRSKWFGLLDTQYILTIDPEKYIFATEVHIDAKGLNELRKKLAKMLHEALEKVRKDVDKAKDDALKSLDDAKAATHWKFEQEKKRAHRDLENKKRDLESAQEDIQHAKGKSKNSTRKSKEQPMKLQNQLNGKSNARIRIYSMRKMS